MQQVIYVDVLVFLNTVITFLILLTTTEIARIDANKGRLIIGSVVGGAYSLLILAPPMNIFFVIITRLAICVSVVFITYNLKNIRKMFRCLFSFIIISFIFAGGIYALSGIINNDFISVNNSYAYINLSTVSLIFITLVFYAAIKIINKKLFRKTDSDMIYKIEIFYKDKKISSYALFDSGNSVSDLYMGRPVIIIGDKEAMPLLSDTNAIRLKEFLSAENNLVIPPEGFRILPVNTLGGESLLPAFTADKASVSDGDILKIIERPCIAISADMPVDTEYKALINKETIRQAV